jgi:hypothetical protein
VRILVDSTHRDGWSIHLLAENANTVLTKWTVVASQDMMLRLFRACGAKDDVIADVKRDVARWGRGSVWLDADEEGRKMLRIR